MKSSIRFQLCQKTHPNTITTPSQAVKADVDAIYAAGWIEQAFMDVVGMCCVINFMNRFINDVGVDVDADTAHKTGASVLPTIGYSGWANSLEKSFT